jgi:hypothetical protein
MRMRGRADPCALAGVDGSAPWILAVCRHRGSTPVVNDGDGVFCCHAAWGESSRYWRMTSGENRGLRIMGIVEGARNDFQPAAPPRRDHALSRELKGVSCAPGEARNIKDGATKCALRPSPSNSHSGGASLDRLGARVVRGRSFPLQRLDFQHPSQGGVMHGKSGHFIAKLEILELERLDRSRIVIAANLENSHAQICGTISHPT